MKALDPVMEAEHRNVPDTTSTTVCAIRAHVASAEVVVSSCRCSATEKTRCLAAVLSGMATVRHMPRRRHTID